MVLQACDEAGITWVGGEKTTEWCPFETYPFDICFFNNSYGISADNSNICEMCGLENITDWFFNAIKNNDGNLIPKLTPQNAEQEHLVQILLAMKQSLYVEVDYGSGWVNAVTLFHNGDFKYRINPNPNPTPIPVSRKIWKKINKEFRFIVMDKNERFYHCKKAPKRVDGEWLLSEVEHIKSPLVFNSDGIDWRTSLTERPEGV
ncbi:hypothetical protein H3S75_05370 [Gilliamella sp. B14384G15]|uniref:hypothetical protein n=1 Tax=unclassified Gilliamella TaxID=2685620 RepID=UPI0018DAF79E|nr:MULTISPECIES: hypothetical protein [unclassified Gilliamella]MBI0030657.1 hypothetical protein [Gilliamella sp. B14384G15]MBI0057953.1 hypothetical protein [Gilliamella sp. B14384G12]